MALRTFHFNPDLGGFGGESTDSDPSKAATPDAFCQIVKELVDNAIDACRQVPQKISKTQNVTPDHKTKDNGRRVRVVIERFQDTKNSKRNCMDQVFASNDKRSEDAEDLSESREIYRVTVSDNGCGMKDIQRCVDAFQTNKAHESLIAPSKIVLEDEPIKNKKGKSTKRKRRNKVDSKVATASIDTTEKQTGGRYGIGLTLCLLHAQRLVPNSCASIRSATSEDGHWKTVVCIVDMARDSVRCIFEDNLDSRSVDTKSFESESGTSISVLVPGGNTARCAWPRLAEYFARFKLCLGLPCTVEVLTPILSRTPLLVEPPWCQKHSNDRVGFTFSNSPEDSRVQNLKNESDFEEDDEIDSKENRVNGRSMERLIKTESEIIINERRAIWQASQVFLGRPVELMNVSHSITPIETNVSNRRKKRKTESSLVDSNTSKPMIRVSLVVCGPPEESAFEYDELELQKYDLEHENYFATKRASVPESQTNAVSSASMSLIRMVNNIPILDSCEALACGLVQGVLSKKNLWNSFGLELNVMPVDNSEMTETLRTPTFDIIDSEQVAPFFKQGVHKMLETDFKTIDDKLSSQNEKYHKSQAIESIDSRMFSSGHVPEPSMLKYQRKLLPASLRLGNVLLIVQINSRPTTLPLPTLSKGRLPSENAAIDRALEIGVTECLKSLKQSNPSLLLTASELKRVERDSRYVPAAAAAMASILSKSQLGNENIINLISSWSIGESQNKQSNLSQSKQEFLDGDKRVLLGKHIQERLQSVITDADSSRNGPRKVQDHTSTEFQQVSPTASMETMQLDEDEEDQNIEDCSSEVIDPSSCSNCNRSVESDNKLDQNDSVFDEWF